MAVFLIAVLTSSFVANRQFFSKMVTIGYPSFTTAMRDLRDQAPPNATLMGASVAQIFWYADRHVVNFPPASELSAALEQCDWVIVTNFERSQKPYVGRLATMVTREDVESGNAAAFRSGKFLTLLIRANLVRQRL